MSTRGGSVLPEGCPATCASEPPPSRGGLALKIKKEEIQLEEEDGEGGRGEGVGGWEDEGRESEGMRQ
ncbi:hypothetical protein E2C01_066294 [Portunus trituberculatus]|uniref:Uncharacterized protein n=1 Tax=Portunus trituberculatus TaxID=210409 RepID=A0A5B7HL50_PORTR|nr:hypothetical protein [Portunus trituberculatus]